MGVWTTSILIVIIYQNHILTAPLSNPRSANKSDLKTKFGKIADQIVNPEWILTNPDSKKKENDPDPSQNTANENGENQPNENNNDNEINNRPSFKKSSNKKKSNKRKQNNIRSNGKQRWYKLVTVDYLLGKLPEYRNNENEQNVVLVWRNDDERKIELNEHVDILSVKNLYNNQLIRKKRNYNNTFPLQNKLQTKYIKQEDSKENEKNKLNMEANTNNHNQDIERQNKKLENKQNDKKKKTDENIVKSRGPNSFEKELSLIDNSEDDENSMNSKSIDNTNENMKFLKFKNSNRHKFQYVVNNKKHPINKFQNNQTYKNKLKDQNHAQKKGKKSRKNFIETDRPRLNTVKEKQNSLNDIPTISRYKPELNIKRNANIPIDIPELNKIDTMINDINSNTDENIDNQNIEIYPLSNLKKLRHKGKSKSKKEGQQQPNQIQNMQNRNKQKLGKPLGINNINKQGSHPKTIKPNSPNTKDILIISYDEPKITTKINSNIADSMNEPDEIDTILDAQNWNSDEKLQDQTNESYPSSFEKKENIPNYSDIEDIKEHDILNNIKMHFKHKSKRLGEKQSDKSKELPNKIKEKLNPLLKSNKDNETGSPQKPIKKVVPNIQEIPKKSNDIPKITTDENNDKVTKTPEPDEIDTILDAQNWNSDEKLQDLTNESYPSSFETIEDVQNYSDVRDIKEHDISKNIKKQLKHKSKKVGEKQSEDNKKLPNKIKQKFLPSLKSNNENDTGTPQKPIKKVAPNLQDIPKNLNDIPKITTEKTNDKVAKTPEPDEIDTILDAQNWNSDEKLQDLTNESYQSSFETIEDVQNYSDGRDIKEHDISKNIKKQLKHKSKKVGENQSEDDKKLPNKIEQKFIPSLKSNNENDTGTPQKPIKKVAPNLQDIPKNLKDIPKITTEKNNDKVAKTPEPDEIDTILDAQNWNSDEKLQDLTNELYQSSFETIEDVQNYSDVRDIKEHDISKNIKKQLKHKSKKVGENQSEDDKKLPNKIKQKFIPSLKSNNENDTGTPQKPIKKVATNLQDIPKNLKDIPKITTEKNNDKVAKTPEPDEIDTILDTQNWNSDEKLQDLTNESYQSSFETIEDVQNYSDVRDIKEHDISKNIKKHLKHKSKKVGENQSEDDKKLPNKIKQKIIPSLKSNNENDTGTPQKPIKKVAPNLQDIPKNLKDIPKITTEKNNDKVAKTPEPDEIDTILDAQNWNSDEKLQDLTNELYQSSFETIEDVQNYSDVRDIKEHDINLTMDNSDGDIEILDMLDDYKNLDGMTMDDSDLKKTNEKSPNTKDKQDTNLTDNNKSINNIDDNKTINPEIADSIGTLNLSDEIPEELMAFTDDSLPNSKDDNIESLIPKDDNSQNILEKNRSVENKNIISEKPHIKEESILNKYVTPNMYSQNLSMDNSDGDIEILDMLDDYENLDGMTMDDSDLKKNNEKSPNTKDKQDTNLTDNNKSINNKDDNKTIEPEIDDRIGTVNLSDEILDDLMAFNNDLSYEKRDEEQPNDKAIFVDPKADNISKSKKELSTDDTLDKNSYNDTDKTIQNETQPNSFESETGKPISSDDIVNTKSIEIPIPSIPKSDKLISNSTPGNQNISDVVDKMISSPVDHAFFPHIDHGGLQFSSVVPSDDITVNAMKETDDRLPNSKDDNIESSIPKNVNSQNILEKNRSMENTNIISEKPHIKEESILNKYVTPNMYSQNLSMDNSDGDIEILDMLDDYKNLDGMTMDDSDLKKTNEKSPNTKDKQDTNLTDNNKSINNIDDNKTINPEIADSIGTLNLSDEIPEELMAFTDDSLPNSKDDNIESLIPKDDNSQNILEKNRSVENKNIISEKPHIKEESILNKYVTPNMYSQNLSMDNSDGDIEILDMLDDYENLDGMTMDDSDLKKTNEKSPNTKDKQDTNLTDNNKSINNKDDNKTIEPEIDDRIGTVNLSDEILDDLMAFNNDLSYEKRDEEQPNDKAIFVDPKADNISKSKKELSTNDTLDKNSYNDTDKTIQNETQPNSFESETGKPISSDDIVNTKSIEIPIPSIPKSDKLISNSTPGNQNISDVVDKMISSPVDHAFFPHIDHGGLQFSSVVPSDDITVNAMKETDDRLPNSKDDNIESLIPKNVNSQNILEKNRSMENTNIISEKPHIKEESILNKYVTPNMYSQNLSMDNSDGDIEILDMLDDYKNLDGMTMDDSDLKKTNEKSPNTKDKQDTNLTDNNKSINNIDDNKTINPEIADSIGTLNLSDEIPEELMAFTDDSLPNSKDDNIESLIPKDDNSQNILEKNRSVENKNIISEKPHIKEESILNKYVTPNMYSQNLSMDNSDGDIEILDMLDDYKNLDGMTMDDSDLKKTNEKSPNTKDKQDTNLTDNNKSINNIDDNKTINPEIADSIGTLNLSDEIPEELLAFTDDSLPNSKDDNIESLIPKDDNSQNILEKNRSVENKNIISEKPHIKEESISNNYVTPNMYSQNSSMDNSDGDIEILDMLDDYENLDGMTMDDSDLNKTNEKSPNTKDKQDTNLTDNNKSINNIDDNKTINPEIADSIGTLNLSDEIPEELMAFTDDSLPNSKDDNIEFLNPKDDNSQNILEKNRSMENTNIMSEKPHIKEESISNNYVTPNMYSQNLSMDNSDGDIEILDMLDYKNLDGMTMDDSDLKKTNEKSPNTKDKQDTNLTDNNKSINNIDDNKTINPEIADSIGTLNLSDEIPEELMAFTDDSLPNSKDDNIESLIPKDDNSQNILEKNRSVENKNIISEKPHIKEESISNNYVTPNMYSQNSSMDNSDGDIEILDMLDDYENLDGMTMDDSDLNKTNEKSPNTKDKQDTNLTDNNKSINNIDDNKTINPEIADSIGTLNLSDEIPEELMAFTDDSLPNSKDDNIEFLNPKDDNSQNILEKNRSMENTNIMSEKPHIKEESISNNYVTPNMYSQNLSMDNSDGDIEILDMLDDYKNLDGMTMDDSDLKKTNEKSPNTKDKQDTNLTDNNKSINNIDDNKTINPEIADSIGTLNLSDEIPEELMAFTDDSLPNSKDDNIESLIPKDDNSQNILEKNRSVENKNIISEKPHIKEESISNNYVTPNMYSQNSSMDNSDGDIEILDMLDDYEYLDGMKMDDSDLKKTNEKSPNTKDKQDTNLTDNNKSINNIDDNKTINPEIADSIGTLNLSDEIPEELMAFTDDSLPNSKDDNIESLIPKNHNSQNILEKNKSMENTNIMSEKPHIKEESISNKYVTPNMYSQNLSMDNSDGDIEILDMLDDYEYLDGMKMDDSDLKKTNEKSPNTKDKQDTNLTDNNKSINNIDDNKTINPEIADSIGTLNLSDEIPEELMAFTDDSLPNSKDDNIESLIPKDDNSQNILEKNRSVENKNIISEKPHIKEESILNKYGTPNMYTQNLTMENSDGDIEILDMLDDYEYLDGMKMDDSDLKKTNEKSPNTKDKQDTNLTDNNKSINNIDDNKTINPEIADSIGTLNLSDELPEELMEFTDDSLPNSKDDNIESLIPKNHNSQNILEKNKSMENTNIMSEKPHIKEESISNKYVTPNMYSQNLSMDNSDGDIEILDMLDDYEYLDGMKMDDSDLKKTNEKSPNTKDKQDTNLTDNNKSINNIDDNKTINPEIADSIGTLNLSDELPEELMEFTDDSLPNSKDDNIESLIPKNHNSQNILEKNKSMENTNIMSEKPHIKEESISNKYVTPNMYSQNLSMDNSDGDIEILDMLDDYEYLDGMKMDDSDLKKTNEKSPNTKDKQDTNLTDNNKSINNIDDNKTINPEIADSIGTLNLSDEIPEELMAFTDDSLPNSKDDNIEFLNPKDDNSQNILEKNRSMENTNIMSEKPHIKEESISNNYVTPNMYSQNLSMDNSDGDIEILDMLDDYKNLDGMTMDDSDLKKTNEKSPNTKDKQDTNLTDNNKSINNIDDNKTINPEIADSIGTLNLSDEIPEELMEFTDDSLPNSKDDNIESLIPKNHNSQNILEKNKSMENTNIMSEKPHIKEESISNKYVTPNMYSQNLSMDNSDGDIEILDMLDDYEYLDGMKMDDSDLKKTNEKSPNTKDKQDTNLTDNNKSINNIDDNKTINPEIADSIGTLNLSDEIPEELMAFTDDSLPNSKDDNIEFLNPKDDNSQNILEKNRSMENTNIMSEKPHIKEESISNNYVTPNMYSQNLSMDNSDGDIEILDMLDDYKNLDGMTMDDSDLKKTNEKSPNTKDKQDTNLTDNNKSINNIDDNKTINPEIADSIGTLNLSDEIPEELMAFTDDSLPNSKDDNIESLIPKDDNSQNILEKNRSVENKNIISEKPHIKEESISNNYVTPNMYSQNSSMDNSDGDIEILDMLDDYENLDGMTMDDSDLNKTNEKSPNTKDKQDTNLTDNNKSINNIDDNKTINPEIADSIGTLNLSDEIPEELMAFTDDSLPNSKDDNIEFLNPKDDNSQNILEKNRSMENTNIMSEKPHIKEESISNNYVTPNMYSQNLSMDNSDGDIEILDMLDDYKNLDGMTMDDSDLKKTNEKSPNTKDKQDTNLTDNNKSINNIDDNKTINPEIADSIGTLNLSDEIPEELMAFTDDSLPNSKDDNIESLIPKDDNSQNILEKNRSVENKNIISEKPHIKEESILNKYVTPNMYTQNLTMENSDGDIEILDMLDDYEYLDGMKMDDSDLKKTNEKSPNTKDKQDTNLTDNNKSINNIDDNKTINPEIADSIGTLNLSDELPEELMEFTDDSLPNSKDDNIESLIPKNHNSQNILEKNKSMENTNIMSEKPHIKEESISNKYVTPNMYSQNLSMDNSDGDIEILDMLDDYEYLDGMKMDDSDLKKTNEKSPNTKDKQDTNLTDNNKSINNIDDNKTINPEIADSIGTLNLSDEIPEELMAFTDDSLPNSKDDNIESLIPKDDNSQNILEKNRSVENKNIISEKPHIKEESILNKYVTPNMYSQNLSMDNSDGDIEILDMLDDYENLDGMTMDDSDLKKTNEKSPNTKDKQDTNLTDNNKSIINIDDNKTINPEIADSIGTLNLSDEIPEELMAFTDDSLPNSKDDNIESLNPKDDNSQNILEKNRSMENTNIISEKPHIKEESISNKYVTPNMYTQNLTMENSDGDIEILDMLDDYEYLDGMTMDDSDLKKTNEKSPNTKDKQDKNLTDNNKLINNIDDNKTINPEIADSIGTLNLSDEIPEELMAFTDDSLPNSKDDNIESLIPKDDNSQNILEKNRSMENTNIISEKPHIKEESISNNYVTPNMYSQNLSMDNSDGDIEILDMLDDYKNLDGMTMDDSDLKKTNEKSPNTKDKQDTNLTDNNKSINNIDDNKTINPEIADSIGTLNLSDEILEDLMAFNNDHSYEKRDEEQPNDKAIFVEPKADNISKSKKELSTDDTLDKNSYNDTDKTIQNETQPNPFESETGKPISSDDIVNTKSIEIPIPSIPKSDKLISNSTPGNQKISDVVDKMISSPVDHAFIPHIDLDQVGLQLPLVDSDDITVNAIEETDDRLPNSKDDKIKYSIPKDGNSQNILEKNRSVENTNIIIEKPHIKEECILNKYVTPNMYSQNLSMDISDGDIEILDMLDDYENLDGMTMDDSDLKKSNDKSLNTKDKQDNNLTHNNKSINIVDDNKTIKPEISDSIGTLNFSDEILEDPMAVNNDLSYEKRDEEKPSDKLISVELKADNILKSDKELSTDDTLDKNCNMNDDGIPLKFIPVKGIKQKNKEFLMTTHSMEEHTKTETPKEFVQTKINNDTFLLANDNPKVNLLDNKYYDSNHIDKLTKIINENSHNYHYPSNAVTYEDNSPILLDYNFMNENDNPYGYKLPKFITKYIEDGNSNNLWEAVPPKKNNNFSIHKDSDNYNNDLNQSIDYIKDNIFSKHVNNNKNNISETETIKNIYDDKGNYTDITDIHNKMYDDFFKKISEQLFGKIDKMYEKISKLGNLSNNSTYITQNFNTLPDDPVTKKNIFKNDLPISKPINNIDEPDSKINKSVETHETTINYKINDENVIKESIKPKKDKHKKHKRRNKKHKKHLRHNRHKKKKSHKKNDKNYDDDDDDDDDDDNDEADRSHNKYKIHKKNNKKDDDDKHKNKKSHKKNEVIDIDDNDDNGRIKKKSHKKNYIDDDDIEISRSKKTDKKKKIKIKKSISPHESNEVNNSSSLQLNSEDDDSVKGLKIKRKSKKPTKTNSNKKKKLKHIKQSKSMKYKCKEIPVDVSDEDLSSNKNNYNFEEIYVKSSRNNNQNNAPKEKTHKHKKRKHKKPKKPLKISKTYKYKEIPVNNEDKISDENSVNLEETYNINITNDGNALKQKRLKHKRLKKMKNIDINIVKDTDNQVLDRNTNTRHGFQFYTIYPQYRYTNPFARLFYNR